MWINHNRINKINNLSFIIWAIWNVFEYLATLIWALSVKYKLLFIKTWLSWTNKTRFSHSSKPHWIRVQWNRSLQQLEGSPIWAIIKQNITRWRNIFIWISLIILQFRTALASITSSGITILKIWLWVPLCHRTWPIIWKMPCYLAVHIRWRHKLVSSNRMVLCRVPRHSKARIWQT